MPYTKAKSLCQLCGRSVGVRYMVLLGIVSVNICHRCRVHFCISEEEARAGRVESVSRRDSWREGLRCQKKEKEK